MYYRTHIGTVETGMRGRLELANKSWGKSDISGASKRALDLNGEKHRGFQKSIAGDGPS